MHCHDCGRDMHVERSMRSEACESQMECDVCGISPVCETDDCPRCVADALAEFRATPSEGAAK